jgi:adenylate cyclase
MERAAAWLWGRWSTHFELYYLGLGIPAGVLAVGLPTSAVVASYLGLERHDAVTLAVVVCSVILVGTPLAAAVVGRRYFAVVRRWARGDHSDPDVAHATFIRMARFIALRTAAALFVAHLLTTCVVAVRVAHLSAAAALALVFALILVLCSGGVLLTSALELLLVPAMREAAAEAGGSMAEPARSRLSTRLTLLAGAAAWFAAAIPGALTTHTTDPQTRWVVAIASATVVATLLTLAYFRMLALPTVMQPIRELIGAARAVTAGDLAVQVPVTSQDELAELSGSFNEMVRGLSERERLRNAFGSYVDPVLARRLAEQPDAVFAGEQVDVTVLFADIRGFTAYADVADARDVVARLNNLFALVVPVLRDYGGHPNKYLGDGLLAVFGAPVPFADHAASAVAAAGAMQRAVISSFGDTLRLGIGINTGDVVAGTIGGGGKLEFTLIGDTVNVAARVEQLTKETNDLVLLTEATKRRLRDAVPLVDRGRHVVRGKASTVHVYALELSPD